ncbi:MAG: hypothetical protein ACFFCV_19325 [Promethearchaeota archaeon]
MARSFYGACIGFIGGLLIGWIIESFIMDAADKIEFLRITNNISIVIILGIAGLVIGFIIMYVTSDKE